METIGDVTLSMAVEKLREGLDEITRCIGKNERPSMTAVTHLAFALGIMEAYLKRLREKNEI
jgi:hypothetical protein